MAMGSDPYGPSAVNYLDVSSDGKYVAGVRQDGEILVVDLAKRKVVERLVRGHMPGFPGPPKASFVAFRGEGGRFLWDCRNGSVCETDLETGKQEFLVDHDPQDTVRVAAVSADGKRMVFGTAGGRLFSYDAVTKRQSTLKPRDIWSRVVSPMYTLESNSELQFLVSATARIGASVRYETDARTKHYPEGYIDVPNYGMADSWVRDVLYRGINIWDWETGERFMIDDDFSDKIRADWSRDGRLVAINQQGGSSYFVYEVGEDGVRWVTDLSKAGARGCDGMRFLDVEGRYLGVVSYGHRFMEVIDRATVDVNQYAQGTDLKLREKPAGGRRMMVAYPEKGWVFLGLRNGGIDWYQFQSEPKLSLRHIATLR